MGLAPAPRLHRQRVVQFIYPMIWKTAKRELNLDRPLVMAILNATPDSFSDGGTLANVGDAIRQVEKFIAEGADIIDVGGESTRPGSERVSIDEETRRVIPVVEQIAKRFDIPISVDTSKAEIAERAIDAGAEIINDISGLRFDGRIAEVASNTRSGLVLMHSRGEFETMHTQPPVENILSEVSEGLNSSVEKARSLGVKDDQIVLDTGIGFGKTLEQNLELIAKLGKLTTQFPDHPMLVGTSRKSFIGKLLGGAPVDGRLAGSVATAAIAAWNGANILRVHDVKATADMVRVVHALMAQR